MPGAMAPSKASRSAEDHRLDVPGPKDKTAAVHASAKMRRGASQMSASQPLREAPTSAPTQPAADAATAPTIDWSSLHRDTLHAYRRRHQLNTPTSFSTAYHQWVLSQPRGIGLHSPTMICKRKHRRQGKDQLAMAVRKHSNGMGIHENDVIVDFIYKVRSDKAAKSTGPNKQAFLVAS